MEIPSSFNDQPTKSRHYFMILSRCKLLLPSILAQSRKVQNLPVKPADFAIWTSPVSASIDLNAGFEPQVPLLHPSYLGKLCRHSDSFVRTGSSGLALDILPDEIPPQKEKEREKDEHRFGTSPLLGSPWPYLIKQHSQSHHSLLQQVHHTQTRVLNIMQSACHMTVH